MTIIVLLSVGRIVGLALRRAMLSSLSLYSPAEIGLIAATAAVCWGSAWVLL
jgi:hypothetical protein